MLRRSAEKSSLSATFTSEIGKFSFQYRKAFTGGENNRNYKVDVTNNGITTTYTIPTFGASGTDETVHTFAQELNLEGEVVIKIYATGAKGNQQATFDNFAWTEHGDVEHNTVQFGGSSGADAKVYTVNLTDLNYTGEVVVIIKNVGTATANKQTVIDNVVWIENE